MKTSSCKAKGRLLCKKLKGRLMQQRGPLLLDEDIRVTSSGVTGEDLQLSPAAKAKFPFKFECKNQEKLNLYEAWKQAKSHKGTGYPVLVVSKNRFPEPLVVMELKDWLEFIG